MAVAWGQYINGISVYGKDPVHTCAHALHTSISNGCLWISARGSIINATKEEYGANWIETLVGSGLGKACFDKSAGEVPNFQNCSSAS